METPRSAAAEVARQLNAQIREIAESLAAQGDESHKYTFFCECGCLQPLARTLPDIAREGFALADGHQPPRASSSSERHEDEPPPLGSPFRARSRAA
jgi:hypothetical protein